MTDRNIRAHAFNAVAPALNETGHWLPLSVREHVAAAVLDALDAAGYTVVPVSEYEDLLEPFDDATEVRRG